MKWGTFPYKIMPFGLINAGATFQMTMDINFGGLIGHNVVFYLDNVTVLSKKREDHVFHLKQIFNRCRKYGIYLNPKKSLFHSFRRKTLGSYYFKKGNLHRPRKN